MKLKLCKVHNAMTNHIGNHCLKCIHEPRVHECRAGITCVENPPVCGCGKLMTPVIENGKIDEHSFKCENPECEIYKKGLYLSIG